jgi:membrane-bound lytic murein transglycosylase D
MTWKCIPFLVVRLVLYSQNSGGQDSYSAPSTGSQTSFLHKNPVSVNNPGGSSEIDYSYHIGKLDQRTPIHMVYNADVKRYIDVFLGIRRGDLEQALSRSAYYFPIFEEALDRHDLPLELKYIAVIESGLNPFARSKSGAVGLWQLLYATCSLLDLTVDSYIDQRKDTYIATEAACVYLRYLHNTYRDWNLVLAAYNGGPGEVRKAIERSGGITGYWDLRPFLSEQARNYVPAFISIAYLMENTHLHHIDVTADPLLSLDTDTLHINYSVSFRQISSVLEITPEELKKLNPVYKQMYIPDLEEACTLVLPAKLISEYLQNEGCILGSAIPEPDYHTLVAIAGNIADKRKLLHTVQQGEFCHKIAIRYNCTIENLLAWNCLESLTLFPGQELEIWVDE